MKKRFFSILLAAVMLFSLAVVPDTRTAQASVDSYKAAGAGRIHNLAIKTDGSLWAWGSNEYGQLGDGTNTTRLNPVKVMDNVAVVSAGSSHNLAVKTDGSLWVWGYNNQGQLGDGTTTNRNVPVKIMDNAKAVSAGISHSFAIKTDGSLWVWGDNMHRQLGVGTDEKGVITPVKMMDDVAFISAGAYHNLAVKTDRSLWTWGANDYGRLGTGEDKSEPVPVKIMDDVIKIAAGDEHSLAVKADGSLWAWGRNTWGALGDSTTISKNAPAKIMEDVADVAAASHSMALKTDGSLWVWGANGVGQLGDGSYRSKTTPAKIMDSVAAISAGRAVRESRSFAIKSDGSLWIWGENSNGRTGDGTINTSLNTPTQFTGESSAESQSPASASSSSSPIKIMLDGQSTNVSALIENGRTMIPIRSIAGDIGADVEWDAKDRVVTLVRAGITVKLTIGSNVAQINGKDHTLDAAPAIYYNSTYIPLRFMAEAFSQKVEWDAQSRTVMIEEDMSFAKDSNLTEWLLGVGAIIAREADGDGGPYRIGIGRRESAYIFMARRSLNQNWGINSRETLLQTIDNIANHGHSYQFDRDAALFKSLSAAEQNILLSNAQGIDAYMWPYVVSLDKKWGDKSVRAWDWFRVGHLCRWGYNVGYITLEEAYTLFEPTARNLRATFSSWDEATENYLDGYAYWGRIDVSVRSDENNYWSRKDIYENLKAKDAIDPRGMLFNPRVWIEPVKGI